MAILIQNGIKSTAKLIAQHFMVNMKFVTDIHWMWPVALESQAEDYLVDGVSIMQPIRLSPGNHSMHSNVFHINVCVI